MYFFTSKAMLLIKSINTTSLSYNSKVCPTDVAIAKNLVFTFFTYSFAKLTCTVYI